MEGVARLALAWRALGIDRGDRVAILSENRPEWMITDYAVLGAGGVVVPIYTTLSAAQMEYILSNSGAKGIVVSTPELLERIASIRARLPRLSHVVLMDEPAPADNGVLSFRDLVRQGRDLRLKDPDAFRRIAASAEPTDLASIIYTSGTTGPPKGVMLSHGNFASNVEAVSVLFEFTPADRALSFLPLSHVFERIADYMYMYRGVTIVHLRLEHLLEGLTAMQPTVIASVPRLFEKIRDRIARKVAESTPLKRRIFAWALEAGRIARLDPLNGGPPASLLAKLKCAVADRLVLRKVVAALGGRLRYAISGGAALPREVLEHFITLGIPITEGYGLTEASPVVTLNEPRRVRPGTVGRPLAGVEVRTDEDGEILVRGPNVMQGYFHDPEATAAVIVDGWLRTGDVGSVDADGYLSITDRKKDLIITSGGKNVAPQLIESAIRSTGLVSQVIVIGNGRRFVSALIAPDREMLGKVCRELGVSIEPIEQAIQHPGVVQAYSRAIQEAMRDFAPYEQVRKFTLLPRDFAIETGELTPTLKVRRREVESRCRAIIEAMYSEDVPSIP